jgi:hypothetical protein
VVFLTPMLPMLMILAAGTAGQPVDSSPVTRSQSELHTPDSIAPAVLPYLACLYAARGLPFLRGSDGRQISYDKRDNDCSATKRRAEAEAVKMLEHKPIPGGAEPAVFVANALSDMEAFVAALPVRQNADTSRHLPVVGLPMTMEDEVGPAYRRYEDCLKTQVSYTAVTVDTVLAVFQQAMTICRSVRESAVIDARNALVKKGWDAAASADVAERTFATADQSWQEKGRQFLASLIARKRP